MKGINKHFLLKKLKWTIYEAGEKNTEGVKRDNVPAVFTPVKSS
jgi:hypothetical protein